MKRIVYADNAATTPVSDLVWQKVAEFMKTEYGNPSSIYSIGRSAKRAIETAREQVAAALGAAANEIYFTSGGSEADNWAIKSVAQVMGAKGKKHLITTNFEHHAVLHTMQNLEKQGFEVTYLSVDQSGLIAPEQVEAAIRPDTALVSIMYANNEIGTVLPIPQIGAICKKAGVLFHTDAVQAIGKISINVKEQNIDMLSLSGHKFHAPKGVGALYCRRGIVLKNLIDGGAQESNRRAGTENTASIVGLGYAIEAAVQNIDEKNAILRKMSDRLIEGVLASIPKCRLNGDRNCRLSGNINFSFEAVEGEALLLMLDMKGICGSSGSACTSGSLDPSHVLLAIGLPHEIAHGSLRLSLSEQNSEEEIDYILETLPGVVQRLRDMSPVWNG